MKILEMTFEVGGRFFSCKRFANNEPGGRVTLTRDHPELNDMDPMTMEELDQLCQMLQLMRLIR